MRALATLLTLLTLVAAMLAAPMPVDAAPPASGGPVPGVQVYLFWAEGCPHCQRAIKFLRSVQEEDPRIGVRYLEITADEFNREALFAVANKMGADRVSVPLAVIGERLTIGYLDDATTGAELRAQARACLERACADRVAALLDGSGAAAQTQAQAQAQAQNTPAPPAGVVPATLRLPLWGEVSTRDLSLPALTVLLGAVDGFNPCAMWTLVFLIGLLLGMKDRARMWILGSAFIVGSAVAYFLFMAAWLKLFLFFGMVIWIRIAIGLVALGSGFYYLREYAVNREALCKVTVPEQRRQVLERLRALALERRFVLALAGIILLAFAVNVVELLCSAGIPAVYTQVLAMSGLPRWQHYAYLTLYIFVYMFDDLVVFVTAMTTLQLSGMTGRYSHFSHLIGGGALVAIGAIMLLRPEWLMLGWTG
jgi:glutaredoxin